jgi:hypothetical protein
MKESLMTRRLSFIFLAGLVLAGCKTITEELPTSSSPTSGDPVVNVPFPVTVTPVALPQPQSPGPTPAPSGGTTSPTSDPSDDGGDEFIPDNQNPVAKVVSKVYFVECGGGAVPGSEGASSADVGCRIHLDTTPKDSGGKPTQPKGGPRWFYSDTSSITVGGSNPFTPVLTVKSPGSTSAYSVIDGVQSNVVSIKFK